MRAVHRYICIFTNILYFYKYIYFYCMPGIGVMTDTVPVLVEPMPGCANRYSTNDSPQRHKVFALVQSVIGVKFGECVWSGG